MEVGGKILCKEINEITAILHDFCFTQNLSIPITNNNKKMVMDPFINYTAMYLSNKLALENVKYYGLSQLGCSGLFDCIYTPNFWIDFWGQFVLTINAKKYALHFDALKDSAHAFSSDFIINLKAREVKGLVNSDKFQLAYGYGFGNHFYCILFKKI